MASKLVLNSYFYKGTIYSISLFSYNDVEYSISLRI